MYHAKWKGAKYELQKDHNFYGKWKGLSGNHTRFVRVHMNSCDFSLEEYAAVEDPIADPELTTFSIKRDQKYILPMLKESDFRSVTERLR